MFSHLRRIILGLATTAGLIAISTEAASAGLVLTNHCLPDRLHRRQ